MLSSECELMLGICFWSRLFNVVPETTARFSSFDYRGRKPFTPVHTLIPAVLLLTVDVVASRLAHAPLDIVHQAIAPTIA